jgi:regulator of sigma E protease
MIVQVIVLYTVIAALIVFGLLIFIHEFGHFLVAKLSDIRVLEFSLGMGPPVAKVKRGETEYSLRVFPLGGFVKMEGEEERVEDPRAFSSKHVLTRMSVIFAGPLMNFILAIILIAVIGFFAGVTTTRISVIPGGPAHKAGIQDGDKIVSIDTVKVDTWDEVVNLISQKPNEEIEVVVRRENSNYTYHVKSDIEQESNRGIIGIKAEVIERSFVESIKSGVEKTFWMSKMILNGIVLIIQGQTKADVVGPVGIIHLVGEAAKIGFLNLLYLAAVISTNLGLFNLLPIPALDGSRIFFLGVELLRGKPIEPEKEGLIHFVGFTLLMILMVFVAYKDIMRYNLF